MCYKIVTSVLQKNNANIKIITPFFSSFRKFSDVIICECSLAKGDRQDKIRI